MGAWLDLLSGWKHAEAGTGSGCPTALERLEEPRGGKKFGAFSCNGGTGELRLRGSPVRPPPVPMGPRPHQLCPSRDRGGHFDAIAEMERTVSPGTRAQGRLNRPGSLYPRFLGDGAPR